MGFLGRILIGIALQIVGYMLTPKSDSSSSAPELDDLDDPVAEAGIPVGVVFGTVLIKGGNTLYYGQKSLKKHTVSSGGK